MKKRNIILILFLVLAMPLLICLIFKTLPIDSVGPLVPITGLINAFVLPFLIYYSISGLIKKRGVQIAFAIASIPIGTLLAIIEMNIFIGFSGLLGIMDYQLM